MITSKCYVLKDKTANTFNESIDSSGYSAVLVNKGVSCSSTLLSWAGTATQVDDYCSRLWQHNNSNYNNSNYNNSNYNNSNYNNKNRRTCTGKDILTYRSDSDLAIYSKLILYILYYS
jgi:hypothetical protein